ncbi:MAG: prepilin peptidase [Firmicutes bacterium]|nr:prepilin peptidase [Bacillota bacterium]
MTALAAWASNHYYIPFLIAILGSIISAYTDIRWGLIKNYATFPLFFFGSAWSYAQGGLSWFTLVLATSVLTAVLSTLIGRIGEGDLKLIAGLSMCVGFPVNLIFLAFFFMSLTVGMIFVRFRLHGYRVKETLMALKSEIWLEMGGVKDANVMVHGKGVQHIGGPAILISLVLAVLKTGVF